MLVFYTFFYSPSPVKHMPKPEIKISKATEDLEEKMEKIKQVDCCSGENLSHLINFCHLLVFDICIEKMYECKPFISSCYGFVGQKAHKS
jgi:hypothetical protein